MKCISNTLKGFPLCSTALIPECIFKPTKGKGLTLGCASVPPGCWDGPDGEQARKEGRLVLHRHGSPSRLCH